MKVTQCTGEGQGSCKRCTEKGKWNRIWCCFLYKIEGLEGCYCSDCVKEIQEKAYGKMHSKSTDNPKRIKKQPKTTFVKSSD